MAVDRTFQLTAHPYKSPTRGSCAYESGDTSSRNAILFVGGLTDGPHTVGYTRHLAKALEGRRDLDYSIFEIRIRSSFIGFGTSSLANDVEDISSLVKYLRSIGRKKIILMGHSTGTQDCMEYANYAKHNNEPVDGFILQAPVSDRESLDEIFPSWPESLKMAEKMIAEGKKDNLMPVDKVPKVFEAPLSAYRFWSLVAPGGDDDYFTSDLDDATVKAFWARFEKPVLVLHSEKDEFVPKHVDAAALNKRFQDASARVSSLSGLIPGASHAVKEDESRKWLAQRVQDFLKEIAA